MSTPSCFGYAPFGKEAHVNIAFVVAMVIIKLFKKLACPILTSKIVIC